MTLAVGTPSAQGVGRMLLKRCIDAVREQNYHVMIGGIDAENQVSIALHRQFGFAHVGTIAQAGFNLAAGSI